MPIYEYEHKGDGCDWGKGFEIEQKITEDRMEVCPNCQQPIVRLISRTFVSTPKSNTELRDMGFTKLVKRDDGVYENVTRRGEDAKYMNKGDASTMPDLSKTISD